LPEVLQPQTAEELRLIFASAGKAKQTVELFGNNSKRLMAGPIAPAQVRVSTARMRRIIQYEPRDLTISVDAGLPFSDLSKELARNGQMVPLEGPYSESATVGGVVSANINGSTRRLYGTARDLVIGMTFVTLEGKMVKSGGMVVKNVAGLDMSKLMIGSFGTLAAITSVNFKLAPKPSAARTFLFSFEDLKTAMAARDAALQGQLTPAAIDLLNPVLAAQLGFKGYVLAMTFVGNDAVVERVNREVGAFGNARTLDVDEEQRFWQSIRSVTPKHLEKFREGVVVRVSATLAECGKALSSVDGPAHVHAGSGVVRAWFTRPDAAAKWLRDWKGVIEFSAEGARENLVLWPKPGGDFEIMKRIKQMFDPESLLNRGRLFGLL